MKYFKVSLLKTATLYSCFLLLIAKPLWGDVTLKDPGFEELDRRITPQHKTYSPLQGASKAALKTARFLGNYTDIPSKFPRHNQLAGDTKQIPQDPLAALLEHIFPSPKGGLLEMSGATSDPARLLTPGVVGKLLTLVHTGTSPEVGELETILRDKRSAKKFRRFDKGEITIFATVLSQALVYKNDEGLYTNTTLSQALLAAALRNANSPQDFDPFFENAPWLVNASADCATGSASAAASIATSDDFFADRTKAARTLHDQNAYQNLSYGTASHKVPGTTETISYSDCLETTIRQFLAIVAYDTKTKVFNTDLLNPQDAFNITQDLLDFFKEFPTWEAQASQSAHDKWSLMVCNLEDLKYDGHTSSDTPYNYELSCSLDNALGTLEILLSPKVHLVEDTALAPEERRYKRFEQFLKGLSREKLNLEVDDTELENHMVLEVEVDAQTPRACTVFNWDIKSGHAELHMNNEFVQSQTGTAFNVNELVATGAKSNDPSLIPILAQWRSPILAKAVADYLKENKVTLTQEWQLHWLHNFVQTMPDDNVHTFLFTLQHPASISLVKGFTRVFTDEDEHTWLAIYDATLPHAQYIAASGTPWPFFEAVVARAERDMVENKDLWIQSAERTISQEDANDDNNRQFNDYAMLDFSRRHLQGPDAPVDPLVLEQNILYNLTLNNHAYDLETQRWHLKENFLGILFSFDSTLFSRHNILNFGIGNQAEFLAHALPFILKHDPKSMTQVYKEGKPTALYSLLIGMDYNEHHTSAETVIFSPLPDEFDAFLDILASADELPRYLAAKYNDAGNALKIAVASHSIEPSIKEKVTDFYIKHYPQGFLDLSDDICRTILQHLDRDADPLYKTAYLVVEGLIQAGSKIFFQESHAYSTGNFSTDLFERVIAAQDTKTLVAFAEQNMGIMLYKPNNPNVSKNASFLFEILRKRSPQFFDRPSLQEFSHLLQKTPASDST